MLHKKTDGFLSSLSSSRGLSDLRKKLKKSDNENCPIKTLNQLLDPSMAVPKTNVSLRSLRSKPSSQTFSRQANDVSIRNEQPSSIVNGPSSVVNAAKENVGSSVSGMVLTNSTREVSVQLSKDDGVFVMPTMTAPRRPKKDSPEWMKEITEAVNFGWVMFQEEDFQGLCHILIYKILNFVEDYSGGDGSQDSEKKELLRYIDAWMNKIVSPEAKDLSGQRYNPEGPGFQDMDNISSVSGYPPFNAPGFTNNSCAPGDAPRFLPSFVKQRQCGDGSVVGSRYGAMSVDNYGNQGLSVGNHSFYCNVPRLLPSFVKQRQYSDSSIVGSRYGGQAMSMDNYGNQSSFFHGHQNQSMMGGNLGHPMNMRSDMSAAPTYSARDQGNGNFSMMGSAPFHRNNQTGQMHMAERMEGNNEMNPSLQRNVGPSYLNRSSVVHPNSDRSTTSYHNYSNRMPSRKVMAPLQPKIVLHRLNSNEGFLQEQGYGDKDVGEERSERCISGRDVMPSNKIGVKDRNPLRSIHNMRDTSDLRNVNVRVAGVENSMVHQTGLRSKSTMIKETPRTRGQKHATDTPARGNIMNDSGAVRVTRSGRAIRAPQHYWSSWS